MITTLCVNCNKPAPEYDQFQELVQIILVHIASGVTIIRLVTQGTDTQKKKTPETAAAWAKTAKEILHAGNDFRDVVANESRRTVHRECPEWKQLGRRLNALLMELDFMRRDLIGHFVPGGIQ